jgi:glycosyltransferase involved in cell wall biosynthesis
VHLGLDHDLFAPIPKTAARRLLNLPQKPIVAMGAFDVRDQWKGGPLFQELHKALLGRDDLAVVLVGASSHGLASARSFGRVTDERYMPFILNAGDVFVSAAIEESFGQMLLEASACAVPVAVFDVGGVRDVVADGETGLLVKHTKVDDLFAAVERLIADPGLRERLGRNARARVERQFTLMHQADAWVSCLKQLF